MNITAVDVFTLRHTLREPFGFSQWWYSQRTALLVRVTADNGLVGWGECYGDAAVNAAVVRDFCGPRVVGQDPRRIGVIWEDLYNRSRDYGRKGAFVAGLSGLDLALWDLQGKALGVPVSTLLGGARVDRVEAYATGMYFTRGGQQASKLAEEAAHYVGQGFRAVKMKVGLGLAADLANVRAVRRAIGPDIRLAIDANHAFSARAAIELGLHAAVEGLWWFEEPVAPEDLDGYADVRAALQPQGVAIAGGECEATRFGFRDLCVRRCVDLLQPDLGAAGGFTAGLQIAALAGAFGLELRPHTWGSAVAVAAALQFLAALPETPGALVPGERWLELDQTENPLRDELIPGFPERDGPWVKVPDGPGLGIEPRLEQLAPWLV
ncbi:MAG: mandelate racemase/muconate lactonizing enzyme family protein [Fimbriimonadaceae bacterium]|nr:mandelate racemase/muconate lactonizing enzyme family protein [Fimbriimonadaceae bacterium]